MSIDLEELAGEQAASTMGADGNAAVAGVQPATDPVGDGDHATEDGEVDGDREVAPPLTRLAIVASLPTLAAAVMIGGIFSGFGARLAAGIAGILGVALAALAVRVRQAALLNLLVLAGGAVIGLLLVVPVGVDHVFGLSEAIAEARAEGDLLRPPVDFDPGWRAIVGWIMALVGFTAGWSAFELRKPSLGLLIPLPIAAIGAISVPEGAQVPSGIAVLVLFALAVGVLAGLQADGDDEEGRRSAAFELRRMVRALPLVALICGALVGLSRTSFLFPPPVIDPAREPQKPETVPLSEVEDRVLFEVESSINGPWRTGSLDVYDGVTWRLPPFAETALEPVPESGVLDSELEPGFRATFTVRGLTEAVLPALPNPVGIVARGPELVYDERTGNVRVSEGQVDGGLVYTITAAALPAEDDLRAVIGSVPPDVAALADIPSPPPEVRDLIGRAPTSSKWDTFNYLRLWVLENVTVSGPGLPVDVPPSRVAEMIAGEREASPFEIVAAQAMLARWVGIPSRIGYGFDGGDLVDGKLEVRPRHGATFVEVYFPGYRWLPVLGTPKNAKPSVGSDAEQRLDSSVLPSEEISAEVFLPVVIPPGSALTRQIRQVLAVVVPAALLLALLYFTWPIAWKAHVRGRRRRAAAAAGPRARIALAYAEWRDLATDFGYRDDTTTPLRFLARFPRDAEHLQLAWLVTRSLWGDLGDRLTEEHAAAAEELSRSLRRRLSLGHPAALRAVAALSRLSLRHPFAPELDDRPPEAKEVPARALATAST